MKEQESRVVEYPCQEVSCPECDATIQFATIHLPFVPQPFMYCQECSNVLLREADLEALDRALTGQSDMTAGTLRFYEELEQSAPNCPCGGRFSLWANVKCPSCGHEIPYNDGIRDPEVQVNDNMIVVIDGATVVKDGPQKTWTCRCQS